MSSDPGDSREQRDAEVVMLCALVERWGIPLAPLSLRLPDGTQVQIDGASDDRTILVEVWAHQGTVKPAQRNKVLADVLKLLHVGSTLPVLPRMVLCLSDHVAAGPFTTGRTWAASALRSFGIEVVVVDLPNDVQSGLIHAQQRQYR